MPVRAGLFASSETPLQRGNDIPDLDIRTFDVLATPSSVLLALGLLIVNLVIAHDAHLSLRPCGATASGTGFGHGTTPETAEKATHPGQLFATLVIYQDIDRQHQGDDPEHAVWRF